MRIRSRIAVVGGVPVMVAAVIAVAGGLLLARSERVYESAVLAGSVYRDVLAATAARIDYLQVAPADRASRADRFESMSDSAAAELRQLDKAGSANTHRAEVERATAVLARYVDQMRSFIQVTAANDSAVADMGLHASTLMALTDRARERQHAANVDSLGSLTEADQRLRDSRDVVDSAHELREAMLDLQRAEAQHVAALGFGVGLFGSGRPLTLADFHIAIDRLIGTADRLQSALDRTDPLVDRYPAKQSAARYAATVDGLQAAVTELRAAQAERDAALSRFETAVQAAAGLGGDDAERPAISSPLGERMLAEQVIRTLPVVRALVLTGTLNRQPDVTFLSSMLPSLRGPLDGLYRVQARAAAAQQALESAQRAGAEAASAIEALTARILMVKATGYTAIQDEVVQLIAYAIQANDTEQETQNVAVVALRLGRRAADAVAVRDAEEADRIVADAGALLETVRGLPMSPLLQDEVLSAIRNWRDSLRRTAEGLRRLNQLLITMDRDAGALVETARQLDETFRDEAARIGELLTRILVIGATIGLLLGGGAAAVVARSISRPVLRLQKQMTRLAEDPLAGPIDGTRRQDEFGAMARAAAFFIREIGLRERAARQAKDRADRALEDLRRTQADLIQAEKMASLGGLVAGVAHEINTPLGNALMGATHLEDRLAILARQASGGNLRRSDFAEFQETADEIARLLVLNLQQACELVQSFKQVAADQTSGEERLFLLKPYLEDLATSLSPSWRRAGHSLRVDCPETIEIDGFPGVLAQILTNFVMNSITHAYREGQRGQLLIAAAAQGADMVTLVYSDDGRGIAPADLGRVFDPFFTTRRGAGSTGLGLHIVYNLVVNRLGGKIAVDSLPDRGVRFTIRFPRRFATDNMTLVAAVPSPQEQ
ncbi:HAMP domain-containing protein [Azospirillum melinis]|uniref:histidine kinase n=1 Tax=Azospirillum melinis TaxID=328839 RepID=A0ABX2K9D4_9PROT|nr:HAMP domain-containing sensor histidine kinase [Azospirillum melinis]MBP2305492.1 signal transduction histidine kinase [Azospirillum melinis]NUA97955.1 HAMP domain-containing protein [Azospirillum melinis]